MTRSSDYQTLVPGIAEAIREQILRGKLLPGGHLRQQELADTLRVSHVPLREALRRLEAEGLVTFVPFKGAIVTPVTVEEVREVQDLAMAVEIALVAIALPRLTDADFEALRHQAAELDAGDTSPEAVVKFYQILYRPAHRPQMFRTVEQMIWRTVRFFPLMQLIRSDLRNNRPTRDDMIQALESRDVERAKTVFTEFNQVRFDALIKALEDQGVDKR